MPKTLDELLGLAIAVAVFIWLFEANLRYWTRTPEQRKAEYDVGDPDMR